MVYIIYKRPHVWQTPSDKSFIRDSRLKKIGLFRPMKGPTVRNAKPTILILTMSKCVTMYGEIKPSTLINDTRCELIFFGKSP